MSNNQAVIPTEDAAAVVLADTLQAFDLLHSATCGKAPLDELVAHYGIKSAHQIMQAVEQVARTRRTTTANSVGTEAEGRSAPIPPVKTGEG